MARTRSWRRARRCQRLSRLVEARITIRLIQPTAMGPWSVGRKCLQGLKEVAAAASRSRKVTWTMKTMRSRQRERRRRTAPGTMAPWVTFSNTTDWEATNPSFVRRGSTRWTISSTPRSARTSGFVPWALLKLTAGASARRRLLAALWTGPRRRSPSSGAGPPTTPCLFPTRATRSSVSSSASSRAVCTSCVSVDLVGSGIPRCTSCPRRRASSTTMRRQSGSYDLRTCTKWMT
mmetsp:Transcript_23490/g.68650  ORF Transcript_23490/g.68650 Transcript_23490/m.68650 type:complete len:234 (-) Transcript_23490:2136-2837(-)